MLKRIVAISGSPSATSSSARLADEMLGRLPPDHEGLHIRLSKLDPAALLAADTANPGIATATRAVAEAHGVILVTPIYKAAYSGMLKCFLDLMDQFGLTGKAVLPLATGGSVAHALALDYGLRPVLQSMGARHVVQGILVLSHHLLTQGSGPVIHADSDRMLVPAFDHFLAAVNVNPTLSQMGHPDPARLNR